MYAYHWMDTEGTFLMWFLFIYLCMDGWILFVYYLFLGKLYTQHGTWTDDPEIKSQPGAPKNLIVMLD